uniref:THO complex subunit 1 n=1 Tax=Caenorhabditis japonica TaxID=281687 RepID=A0A8R1HVD0_CAEJA
MEVAIENRNLDALKELCKAEKKLAKDDEIVTAKVENLLKRRGFKVAEQPSATKEEMARRHFAFAMNCMRTGLCSKGIPYSTLQDLLETSSIDECKQLFSIIEENINEFKQPGMMDSVQNAILRSCNDLLRRLSRTAETSFCGRIMFFLSRFLPLTEKSGVNFMGHFNTANATVYDETDTESEALLTVATSSTPAAESEDIEVGEIEEDNAKEITVTPEMYRQFWSLQKFMSNPNSLYEKDKFAVFKRDLSAVLSLMTSNKLEKPSAEEEEAAERKERKKTSADDVFFAKYLTSPKLLPLQLNDSSFRRYFLMQSIVIFQYLTAECKFKPASKKMVLNEEQAKYISDCEEKCYRLLSDTMPRGNSFKDSLKRIMQREHEWNMWKNANCPDFAEKADKGAMQMYKKKTRTPFNPTNLDLGTPELTKLWNYEPDVLAACRADKRKFSPSLANFIRDPLDEMDPEQQVEEQYKSINDSAFQWRAARLLMAKSPGYISKQEKSAEPTTNIKEFLERTMYNSAKNIDEFKAGIEAREKKEEEARKKVEESLKRKLDTSKAKSSTSSPNPYADTLSDETLAQLAADLAGHAKQLAEVFSIGSAEETLKKTPAKTFCLKVLKEWAEKNGRSGKALLNTLISDIEVVEIAQKSLRKIQEST